MTTGPKPLYGHVGDTVSVTVPHWGGAGFVWLPRFDGAQLQLVGKEIVGPDRDHPSGMRFTFRILAPGARLKLDLARPGAPARESRAYVMDADEGRR